MKTQIEKSSVEQLISAYAEAVNTGNREAIAAFYTEDGLLIPEGFKPVPQGKSRGKYFTQAEVNIGFSVKEIIIEGAYAFVEAAAKTKVSDPSSNRQTKKSTRDLFILKNIEGAWRIYRYLFNSEKQA